ncbi:tachykinin-4 [Silurus meridionalis]|uniref:Uncharacterized protein n=1 Tax=Silurus meridionalis TaxID=175797 RepID=A0A8T0B2S9_SILME|nr:tachykinin-4 [Silurus meridionalis]KAF7698271.1 hypothetical protein HF521_004781 [Silurus meridionalis]
MELFKFSILAFAIYAQLHTGASSFNEDTDVWSLENWQGDPAESGFSLRFNDLLKHSKSHQFHGLMGRSLEIAPPRQLGRKITGTNGETFVGLMGKRSSKRDFEELPDKLQ